MDPQISKKKEKKKKTRNKLLLDPTLLEQKHFMLFLYQGSPWVGESRG